MTEPLSPQYDPAAIEAPLYAWWQERGLYRVEAAGSRHAVRRPDAAAERHRGAARRPRPQQHHPGRAGPLRADARAARTVGSRHRPRRHCHAERGGTNAGQGRRHPFRHRARGVRGAGVGIRARDRWHHPRPAQGARMQLRLVAHLLHARRRSLPRRARGLRAALRQGADLPRQVHHQLVSALPDRAQQRRSREGRPRRPDLVPALSAGRRIGAHHRRHHPPRDDARRHRRRGAPRRRALPPPRGPRRAAAVERPAGADRQRRRSRPGVRHRRREADTGARRHRLRDRRTP